MNIKSFFKVILGFFIVILLGEGYVFAEQEKNSTTTKSAALVQVADVSVYNAKIVGLEKSKATVTFDIHNGKGAQPQIKYGIELVKKTNIGDITVDEKAYDEVLSLSEGQTIQKTLVYEAPKSFSDEYTMYLHLKNESGAMLGLSVVGKITFPGIRNKDSIEILNDTCSLFVSQEKNIRMYTLHQGVDVDSAETLVAKCTVVNNYASKVTLIPAFTTYYRNIYGAVVPDSGADVQPITLVAKEKKIISFTLPKAASPQAYDVRFGLKNGEELSNTVVVHYVIRGTSATIQNITLDKDFYDKNEVAKMTMLWTPSADGFSGSRAGVSSKNTKLFADISVSGKGGVVCISSLTKELSANNLTIDLPIIAACSDPHVSLTIKDDQGVTLVEKKDFAIHTQPKDKNNSLVTIMQFGFVGIFTLLVIVTVIVIYRKKKYETI